MALPVEINPLEMGSITSGYQISRSVRLRQSASAYFNRTTTGSGSNTISTISLWVKRGLISFATNQVLFGSERAASSNGFTIWIDANDVLNWQTNQSGGATSLQLTTTQVFRDPSAWYHLVFAIDTTQATAANRAKIYVNGVQITSFSTTTYPAQNASIWLGTSGLVNYIGRVSSSAIWFLDGYLAEYNVINGQQLTPSSFGSVDTNGIWQPKAYTGTYGTNGFYLKFTDNSAATATTIGKDYSGNGNNWTPNNISVTAGTTYDSMIDSPTVSATASNYAVLNPVYPVGSGVTISNGNLNWSSTSAYASVGNFAISSGKYYWEITAGTFLSSSLVIGIAAVSVGTTPQHWVTGSYGWGYIDDGRKINNNSATSYGATYTTGDIIGVALDLSGGNLTFYKNGVSQGVAYSGLSLSLSYAALLDSITASTVTATANFGQRPFSYTPPTGYVALNTYNLPAATITNGATVMAASTYTGTGATQSIVNSGNNAAATTFKPDMVWLKSRSIVAGHEVIDSVRGPQLTIYPNLTNAEGSVSSVTAFNSNGFTVGTDTGSNTNAATYVGWQWQAGQGTTSSNTNGSITSTVSVNQSAGFSIVTYTATGSFATVGHGLGVAPSFIIIKNRASGTTNWPVYHVSTGNTGCTFLNLTNAFASSANLFNNTTPTSTVFSVSSNTNLPSGATIAYCWSEVAGYSKFGSYTGNGSADGNFIFTNFRPRFVMIKRTDTTGNWYIWDTSRNTYNVIGEELYPNLNNAGSTATDLDILSNGFKLRNTTADFNASGGTYIYAAFAENPFNISRAR